MEKAINSQVQVQNSLAKALGEYDLGIMEKRLREVPGIQNLVVTRFGMGILACLALDIKMNKAAEPDELQNRALKAFYNLSQIHADFNRKFEELAKTTWEIKPRSAFSTPEFFSKVGNKQARTDYSLLEMVCEAYAYSMKKNRIMGYLEKDYARGMAEKRLDCNLSSDVFRDLAKGKTNLDLTGVLVSYYNSDPSAFFHEMVGLRTKSGVERYVETTVYLLRPSKEDVEAWQKKGKLDEAKEAWKSSDYSKALLGYLTQSGTEKFLGRMEHAASKPGQAICSENEIDWREHDDIVLRYYDDPPLPVAFYNVAKKKEPSMILLEALFYKVKMDLER